MKKSITSVGFTLAALAIFMGTFSAFSIQAAGLAITTASPLPTATVGTEYQATISATGGTGSYGWSAQGLPTGIVLTPAVCIAYPCQAPATISGTPRADHAGTFQIAVSVNDNAEVISKVFTLTINQPGQASARYHQNLGMGMRSTAVMQLQQDLATDSLLYPEKLITGYFGSLTQKAVERFQCKYLSLCSGSPSTNGYGFVGPRTRAQLNNLFK